MMRVPRIQGIIRRRLLVNYRLDPEVIARHLPDPFRPKLVAGQSVGGICLIRLEDVRPRFLPRLFGLASENAAHRIAVEWDQDGEVREGVFIPRRDSSSVINHLVGCRLFPGVHHEARFSVRERDGRIDMAMISRDGEVSLEVSADPARDLPGSSVFPSLGTASNFFESGSLGYSFTRDLHRFDGIELRARSWQVRPLAVHKVHSSYFENTELFPAGSATFDHALMMRDIEHEWVASADLHGRPATEFLTVCG